MKAYKKLILTTACIVVVAGSSALSQTPWALTGNTVAVGNFIGSTNNAAFRMRTNNVERVTWETDGDVGIGTAANSITTARQLHIYTNPSAPQIRLSDNTGNAWDVWAGYNLHIRTAAGTDWLRLDSSNTSINIGPNGNQLYINLNGNVGIGTTAPASKLTVNGTLNSATGCWNFVGVPGLKWNTIYACKGTISTSDARMKENIQDLTYGLNSVMQLHPVAFTWKHAPADGTKLGLLAQEAQLVVPEAVKMGDDGTMGIFYSDLIPVLIKAVQEQQGTLRAEEKEQAELQETLRAQEDRIAELEAALGVTR